MTPFLQDFSDNFVDVPDSEDDEDWSRLVEVEVEYFLRKREKTVVFSGFFNFFSFFQLASVRSESVMKESMKILRIIIIIQGIVVSIL